MDTAVIKYRSLTIFVGMFLLAILLFLMIPLSYGIPLPFVYWGNQFLFFLLLAALIYLNVKILAPCYLFKKKYFQYYTILFLSCIIIILILRQTEIWLEIPQAIRQMLPADKAQSMQGSSSLSVSFYIFIVEVLVLVVNIAGIIVKKWEEEQNLRFVMEKEKTDLELSFLKTQINPHFFFNSLNTVNALTYSDIGEARKALKMLGSIMRHVLYNTSGKLISLQNEIEFIETYLDLMKLRLPSKVSLSFTHPSDYNDLKIAPLIFMGFIENCFKHGISSQSNSPISISLKINHSEIVFTCINKNFSSSTKEPGENNGGGIGIQNTERRLQLLYPENYTLSIEQGEAFVVQLKINLR